jgi:hypothetical protein
VSSAVIGFGIGFVPILGSAIGVYAAFTGYDLMTGQRLSPAERVLALLPAGGELLGAAVAGVRLARAARTAEEVAEAAEAATAAERAAAGADDAIEAAEDLARAADEAPKGAAPGLTRHPGTYRPGLSRQLQRDLRRVDPYGPSHEHCMICAIAADKTVNGRPTRALPLDVDDLERVSGRTWKDLVRSFYGSSNFVPMADAEQIARVAEGFGPGTSGLVYVGAEGRHPAHLFNLLVNEAGEAVLFDTQGGLHVYSLNELRSLYRDYEVLFTNLP